MACVPAPTCKQALKEATLLWPNRSKASDGICASATHSTQNSLSDHERGEAFDLTHDPANGCDAHALAERLRLRRDDRVKYIISNGRISNPAIQDGAWRPYTGNNAHRKHAHVSIHSRARNDTRPWWVTTTEEAKQMPGVVDAQISMDGENMWLLFDDGAIHTIGDQTQFHGSFQTLVNMGLATKHPDRRFVAIEPRPPQKDPKGEGGYVLITNLKEAYHFPPNSWSF